MKYATTLQEIYNAFDQDPLSEQDFSYYYGKTMPSRTGDTYYSPINDIFKACIRNQKSHTFLLLGNRGCGKSTELNVLSKRLMDEGRLVKTVSLERLERDPDSAKATKTMYMDVLFVIMEAMLQIAEQSGCEKLTGKANDTLQEFFGETTQIITEEKSTGTSKDYGVSLGDSPIAPFLKLFVDFKRKFKDDMTVKTQYRERIVKNYSDWKDALNSIAKSIAEKCNGKMPVIIFEELDKLLDTEIWDAFYKDAEKLAGFSFSIIYTFRSAFRYDEHYQTSLSDYFETKVFPVIRLVNRDGTPNEDGYQAMREIVKLRANLDLFEPATEDHLGALDYLIKMTGGSPRSLFAAINESCSYAEDRIESGDTKAFITWDDVEYGGLRKFRGDKQVFLYTRLDNPYLKKLIENGGISNEGPSVENRAEFVKFLENDILLEHYNYRDPNGPYGWFSLHPLALEFLQKWT